MSINKSYAFAYYADGKWLGWYGDTFGSISKTPKLYNDLETMKPKIEKNLTNKLTKIKETTFEEAKQNATGLAALFSLAYFSGEELLRGKDIELRIIQCPYYDGPNPEFDREKWKEDFHNDMTTEEPKFWLYADYSKLKEWALQEPQEFIEILKPSFEQ